MNPDVRHLLEGMNPPQADAVQHTEGPLLILAGAGSGKTRVLTRRIAWLLAHDVKPWNILAVTFTNKAAGEMKARVDELVGGGARDVLVSTFHSACARFLRWDIAALRFGTGERARSYTNRFTIYDDDDTLRLIKQLCRERGIDKKAHPPRQIRRTIDTAKNQMLGPDQIGELLRGPRDPSDVIYRAYQDSLLAANAVDFGDLVNLVVKLLTEHPDILDRYRRRFRYLMVDEYQDTNRAQYELVRLLAGPRGTEQRLGNVAVVGDDDQSIYRFRGADIRNILDFERDFPGAKVVRLEQNYRSTGFILQAAHAVVHNNQGRKHKELWTDKGDGERLRTLVGQDEGEEASLVVGTVRRLRGKGRKLSDMAVVYRTNAASRAFERELVKYAIPHVLVGGLKFYQRREVRDLLGYLKLVVNPADDMAVARVINVPSRGIGARSLEGIRQVALERGVPMLRAARLWSTEGRGKARKGAETFVGIIDRLTEEVTRVEPDELVALAVKLSGYGAMLEAEETDKASERVENLEELARALADEGLVGEVDEDGVPLDEDTELDAIGRLQAFLDRASLSGQAEELPDGDDGRLTLLTAHLAKGLEFPVVFVSGMFEGGFPHFMARDLEEDIEEERRLIYVAFTRAEELLYLSRPRRRLMLQAGGGWRDVEPSRFLAEIPPELLQRAGSSGFSRGGGWRAPSREREGWGGSRGAGRRSMGSQRQGQQSLLGGRSPLGPSSTPKPPSGEHRTREPETAEDLRSGVHVVHPKFGPGTILRSDGPPHNLKLTVAFESAGRKTLYARFAKLEIIET